MSVYGNPDVGDFPVDLPLDRKRLAEFSIPEASRVLRLLVALDGLGSGSGSQVVKGVIYNASGTLIATSSEVTIADGAALSWVAFPFDGDEGVALESGIHYFGVHGGAATNSIRARLESAEVVRLTNLVTNPSAEDGTTTGWTPSANNDDAFASSTEQAYAGTHSFKITRDTDGTGAKSISGRYEITGIAEGEVVSAAAHFRAASTLRDSRVSIEFLDASIVLATHNSAAAPEVPDAWVRATLTTPAAPAGTTRARVYCAVDGVPEGESHYFDGAVAVRSATVPDTFDGDSDGYYWTGTAHASTSTNVLPTDTYSDGAAATDTKAIRVDERLSVLVIHFHPYVAPDEEDAYFARLPFHDAQAKLGETGPEAGTSARATCDWHGTQLDPETGSFALVNRDGPLADRIGERIRVQHDNRIVYAYVHDEADLLSDLSLSRRLFLALDRQSTSELVVEVDTLA